MAIYRIHKTKDYTVMANWHLKDKSLSLKSKGLLSLMLSLPDEWDYSIHGLWKISSDGETTIRNTLKELEEHGYLCRTPVRENGKIIDWEYDIHEKPLVENPHVENHTQLNTKELNTKELEKENNKRKDNSNDVSWDDSLTTENKDTNNSSIEEPKRAFEIIWEIYPNKQGKIKAQSAYMKLITGKGADKVKYTNREIWNAVYDYAEHVKKNGTEMKFIQHGSTFFNSGIFDYIEKEVFEDEQE